MSLKEFDAASGDQGAGAGHGRPAAARHPPPAFAITMTTPNSERPQGEARAIHRVAMGLT